jgi:hypothetical protein
VIASTVALSKALEPLEAVNLTDSTLPEADTTACTVEAPSSSFSNAAFGYLKLQVF